jgi:predicted nucleotide-binding protein
MAKRKSTIRRNPPAPNLTIPRTVAESKIYDRITLGKKLLGLSFNNESDLEAAKTQRKKWNDYNEELLKRLFDSEVVFENYNRSSLFDRHIMKASWGQKISSFYEDISNKIETLESIIERLELIPEKVIISETQERYEPETSDTVFVVHGHDDEAKVSVATFIEKLGLKAVILHEQPNAGQTIIEKLERNAAISGYAVIILTSDAIGASTEDPDDAKLRARQNVIFELGYFCGVLGRARVSVLAKEGVEILSDYLGVEYTLMDPEGAWQLSLARDMKSAGLFFDANRIF